MKLNIIAQQDIEIVIAEYFKKFRDYVPDTPLKNESPETLKSLISNVAFMLKRRYSSLMINEVEDIMQRGIEGEFDITLRLLTVPKIYQWFKKYTEAERKKTHQKNEQEYYRYRDEEGNLSWKPPSTTRGAACTYVLFARIGYCKDWHIKNRFEDLAAEDLVFILENLPSDFEEKKLIEDHLEIKEKAY